MANYTADVWMGSMTGRQRVQVQANTWNGARDMIKRIYGPGVKDNDILDLEECRSSSSSYSSSGSTEALFGLIGLGVVGTYHLTKFTVVSSYKVTKFTVNRVVVPTTKFTFNNVVVPSAKYTWKGMKYVATTTVSQVFSFPKNTVIPGVVKLTSDIIEFLTELVNKVMGKTPNYPKVESQYRKEVI